MKGHRALLIFAGLAAGCSTPTADYADPTLGTDGTFAITSVAPADFATVPDPLVDMELTVQGALPADVGLIGVAHSATSLPWAELELADTTVSPARFRGTAALLHGPNALWICARTAAGDTDCETRTYTYSGEAPGLRIASPSPAVSVQSDSWQVVGHATAAPGATITRIRLRVDTGPTVEAAPEPDGRFEREVALPPSLPSPAILRVIAEDSVGRTTTVEVPVHLDEAGPAIDITAPEPNSAYASQSPSVLVEGSVTDDTAVTAVWVGTAAGGFTRSATTDTFSEEVVLEPGAGAVIVMAEDEAGRRSAVSVPVVAAMTVTLDASAAEPFAPIDLELDRYGLDGMIAPEGRDSVALFCLEMRDVVVSLVAALQRPAEWGMTPEDWPPRARNLQTLMAMAPDTAVFEGSSLQAVMDLSEALGIPPASILSTLLDMAPDAPFLATDILVDTLMDHFVLTHPALDGSGTCDAGEVAITLADALSDMATLANTMGPAGEHPGLVGGEPDAVVLTDATRMRIRATSRLIRRAGLDLGAGASAVFELPPSGGPVLDFDFSDEYFELSGVAEYPRVSLPLRIVDEPGTWPGGQSQFAGEDGEFFRGDSPVWTDVPVWSLESIVIDAAYQAYRGLWAPDGYQTELLYSLGEIDEAAHIQWERGWLDITTAGGLGSPPPPQYIWDALVEVAQVRLRDGEAADLEDAPIELPLSGVPLPVTEADVTAQVPGLLNAQQSELSALIAGDWSDYAPAADFMVQEGPEGGYELVWVQGTSAKQTTGAGFYDDPEGTSLLGARVAADANAVVYARDEDERLWAVQVVSVDAPRVTLAMTPVVDATNAEETAP